jgi:hypothetical protein
METTVWFVDNGPMRKTHLGPAIEKLVVYKWQRPWKHFVGISSWDGDHLLVDWTGKPIIRKEAGRTNSPWTLAMNCCSLSTTQVRCRSCTPTAGKDVPLAPQEGHSWVR